VSRWLLHALGWFIITLGACAGRQLGSGKRGFLAVQTRHFTLYTDLDEEAAKEQGRRLEQLLFALQATAWEASGDLPLKLNVVMFARHVEFERYADPKIGGFAFPEELFEPWIVLPAPGFGNGYDTIAHELTHGMAFQAIAHLPRWTSEGLASYFESAHFHSDGSFQIGSVPQQRYQSLQQLGWDRPSTLLRGTYGEVGLRFYGASWLLVHYLMTNHADGFVAFQDHLARGLPELQAWERAFPALPLERLDEAVIGYATAGIYESYIFSLTPPKAPQVSARALSPADQHVLSAMLWKHCAGCSDQAQAHRRVDLEKALELDATNVWAVAFSVSEQLEDKQFALARAKELVRVHPEQWLAWIALGMTAAATGELGALSRDPASDPGARALALAPRQPYALYLAAMTSARRGDREQAIHYLRATQRLQPTNVNLLLARASLLAELSACRELRDAVAALGENAHVQLSAPQLQPLRTAAEHCREPAVGTSAPVTSPTTPLSPGWH
jgi:Protein of unknown function (DUF1570)